MECMVLHDYTGLYYLIGAVTEVLAEGAKLQELKGEVYSQTAASGAPRRKSWDSCQSNQPSQQPSSP
jgi:hypothetical protein